MLDTQRLFVIDNGKVSEVPVDPSWLEAGRAFQNESRPCAHAVTRRDDPKYARVWCKTSRKDELMALEDAMRKAGVPL